jgi:hypothetical protein
VLVGLGGWPLVRRVPEGVTSPLAPEHAPGADEPLAGPEPPASQPFAHWLWLYAFSGFVALSLEIVWFRALDVAVKSTAFTFGTLLAVYLLGFAAGGVPARRVRGGEGMTPGSFTRSASFRVNDPI